MRAHPECPKPRDMHARGVSPKHSDRRAVEGRLVDEHLPLVRQAVSDMSRRLPRHVRKDDLESAAMLGLAQAARSFDPDRGIAFERHASNRIRGALLDELRGADWASRSVRSKARRMQRTADELAVELGHEPTRVQLAAELGVTESRVSQLRTEALALIRDGLTANLDPEALPPEPRPNGRLARRKAAYYAAIASLSDYRARLG